MSQLISENREARFEYEILETFECGIVLLGSEMKPLRQNKAIIKDAYAKIFDDEIFLMQATIPQYSHSTYLNHDETRKRKLLLRKSEIVKIKKLLEEKSLTAVPLKLYFNDKGKVKLLIGIGRGKKLHDKRESIKKRDVERHLKSF